MVKYFIIILLSFTTMNVVHSQTIIRPGEVKLLRFKSATHHKLYCRNKEVGIIQKNQISYAIISENYFSDLNQFSCLLKDGDKVVSEFPLQIRERKYEVENLRVAPNQVQFSQEDLALKIIEEKTYQKILSASHKKSKFEATPFQRPLSSLVTSSFGKKRLFNGDTKGHHFGVDFRAPLGTPIPAANAGIVVFTGNLFLSGNVVFIDHGLDIFTVYNHLSKSVVSVGDVVKKGQTIGLSGNTGRITGPHLHWDVYVSGNYVDGLSLVEESQGLTH